MKTDTLTPTQKRQLIAEHCGVSPQLEWQVMNEDESASCMSGEKRECEEWLSDLRRRMPDSSYASYHVGAWKRFPDYLTSLDAMHEAEKVLTEEQRGKYTMALDEITGNANRAV